VITIDDGKANAYSPDVLHEVAQALDKAQGEARAVVLAGRPGVFSAGYHLPTMRTSPAAMRDLLAQGGRLLMDLFVYPRPVVLACTGHAMAAGAVLLLAGDRRIGAEGAFKFAMNEISVGIPVPVYGVELARYRVPPSLLDAVTFGEVFDPDGAQRVGFLDRVVPADQVVVEAVAEASQLAQRNLAAVAGTKRRLRGAIVAEVLAGLDADMADIPSPLDQA
jgi:enoyl-CoA hydratase